MIEKLIDIDEIHMTLAQLPNIVFCQCFVSKSKQWGFYSIHLNVAFSDPEFDEQFTNMSPFLTEMAVVFENEIQGNKKVASFLILDRVIEAMKRLEKRCKEWR